MPYAIHIYYFVFIKLRLHEQSTSKTSIHKLCFVFFFYFYIFWYTINFATTIVINSTSILFESFYQNENKAKLNKTKKLVEKSSQGIERERRRESGNMLIFVSGKLKSIHKRLHYLHTQLNTHMIFKQTKTYNKPMRDYAHKHRFFSPIKSVPFSYL